MKRYNLAVVLVLIILAYSVSAGCTNTGNNNVNTPVQTSTSITQAVTSIPTTSPAAVVAKNVTVDLSAKNMAFNKTTISVPAGATVKVNFQNQEASGSSQVTGIAHNFAVYDSANATTKIYSGEIITGGQNITYMFTAPEKPGIYFFRCDVHPAIMKGTFIVT